MSDETQKLHLPPVVSAEEWLAARKEFLVREKCSAGKSPWERPQGRITGRGAGAGTAGLKFHDQYTAQELGSSDATAE
jgi:hypothetical protein